MPDSRGPDDIEDGPPRLSLWHRVLLALPSLRRDGDKGPPIERLRSALVKPVEPSAAAKAKIEKAGGKAIVIGGEVTAKPAGKLVKKAARKP